MHLQLVSLFFICLIFNLSEINSLIYNVSTTSDLTSALTKVVAGDTINLADGAYSGNFISNSKNGTKDKPITLKGSKKAILNGRDIQHYYGLHLNNSNYWILDGFTINNSLIGLVLDYSNFNLINNISIHHTGQEGIHFRKNSSDNIFQYSSISYTGFKDAGRGEGVYIGTACVNWFNYPDLSNRNKILKNKLGPYITAEPIDIKEATCCGLIDGNYFDGTGVSRQHHADSWVDCKGINYTISNNKGVNSVLDGFQVKQII